MVDKGKNQEQKTEVKKDKSFEKALGKLERQLAQQKEAVTTIEKQIIAKKIEGKEKLIQQGFLVLDLEDILK